MGVLVVLGSLAAVVLILLAYMRPRKQLPDEPPHVPSFPFFGSLQIMTTPLKFARENEERYGDIFSFTFMGRTFTRIHPRFLNLIKKAPEDQLDHWNGLSSFLMIEDILKTTNELSHQLTHAVNQINVNIGSFVARSNSCLPDLVAKRLSQPREVFNNETLLSTIRGLSTRAIARSMLGEPMCYNAEILKLMETYSADVARCLSIGFVLPKSVALLVIKYIMGPHEAVLKRILVPIIEQRCAQREINGPPTDETSDMLDLIINNIENSDSTVLAQQLAILIFAAVDTTATTASAVLIQVASRPDVRARLRAEMHDVLPELTPQLSNADLKRLKYMEGTIRETLRLYGARYIGTGMRKVMKDFAVGGLVVPAGNIVLVPPMEGNLLDWENSFEFLPERFEKEMQPKEYMAFGVGKHMCPGRFFAINSIKLMMYTLLRDYELVKLSPGIPENTGPIIFAPLEIEISHRFK